MGHTLVSNIRLEPNMLMSNLAAWYGVDNNLHNIMCMRIIRANIIIEAVYAGACRLL